MIDQAIRVLIVDDEDVETTSEYLRTEKDCIYDVTTATDVDGAIDLINNGGPAGPGAYDVAVLDLDMPNPYGRDREAGFHVLKHIRDNTPDIEVVMLTAYGDKPNIINAMELGSLSFVDKVADGWKILPVKIQLAYQQRQNKLLKLEHEALFSRATARIIHDIASPLGVIILAAGDIASPYTPSSVEGAHRHARTICAQAERINVMIHEVIDLIHGVPAKLVKESIVLNEFLADVRPDLELLCESKDITLTITNAYGGRIAVDTDRIRRVILNLISNAVKVLQKNGIITICCRALEDKLQIAVEDNGPGMSEEKQENIFTAADGLKEYTGHGLGLQITREIIEEHNGAIHIESDGKSGTTFIITLPLPKNRE